MNKRVYIGISIIIFIVVVILFAFWAYRPSFFNDFQSAQELEAFLFDEFEIEQDGEQIIYNRMTKWMRGNDYCRDDASEQYDVVVKCAVLGETTWKFDIVVVYFGINFYFSQGLLMDISVEETVVGF
jgi:nitrogen fixation-related uncharacterized protein